ncbi:MAG: phage tail sheath family protein [Acidobacteriaceae bacterium]
MPVYTYPGVYIEEIERGPVPIEGVPTSVAAFLGETERGTTYPTLVTSYKEYQRWFGDVFDDNKFLPFTVSGFFENGGTELYVCRIVGTGAVSAQVAAFGDFAIRTSGPGEWGNRVFAKIEDGTTKKADGSSVGFRVRLAYWRDRVPPFDPFTPEAANQPADQQPTYVEDFDDLVADEKSPDFYGKRLPFIDLDKPNTNQGTESSALGILVRNPGVAPGTAPSNAAQALSGGADDGNGVNVVDFVGDRPNDPQGLSALLLDPFRDVALVYAPAVGADVAKKVVEHCEKQRFRFAVVDAPKGTGTASQLIPRNTITDSKYGAFYYPWIVTSHPRTGARKLVPPGGHVLGVYARSDAERGVFKAPANEILRGALDLEFDTDDATQGILNPQGVNVTRNFPGRGIRVWGARTISSDALWKYVSVRRLFIFIERSIYEGTQWVVFEPNGPALWARVTDTIRLFLRTQWRLGALLGRTEDEAFFVSCDRNVTMTQDDILNGRLICEIGIAPVRPAEFVIFRIFQNTAEAQR